MSSVDICVMSLSPAGVKGAVPAAGSLVASSSKGLAFSFTVLPFGILHGEQSATTLSWPQMAGAIVFRLRWSVGWDTACPPALLLRAIACRAVGTIAGLGGFSLA